MSGPFSYSPAALIPPAIIGIIFSVLSFCDHYSFGTQVSPFNYNFVEDHFGRFHMYRLATMLFQNKSRFFFRYLSHFATQNRFAF